MLSPEGMYRQAALDRGQGALPPEGMYRQAVLDREQGTLPPEGMSGRRSAKS